MLHPFSARRIWLPLVMLLTGIPVFGMPHAAHARSSHTAEKTLAGTLNMNTATAEQWMLLPGVGPSTAAKIVAYRERRPFRRTSDLKRIKGIGDKTYARLRPFLALEGETTLHASPGGP